MFKYLKSANFKLVLVAVIILSTVLSAAKFQEVSAKENYSGEELYKAVVFGQGELGKKLVTDEASYKNLNQKSSKIFANQYVNYIKEQDPEYFKKLKVAMDSNDPTESLELLQSSGHYFDEYTAEQNFKAVGDEVQPACGFFAVCVAVAAVAVIGYNYVGVVQAAAALQVGYAAWALKTKTVNNLTVELNPEAEMASVLNALN